ncbi:MAG: tartrate-resistant acid phosphatase type 5 family protein [Cytophagales bacterium]
MINLNKIVLLLITFSHILIFAQKKKPALFSAKNIEKDAFVFFVIGDWGRNGEYNQMEVANAMKSCAKIADPEFIISTGDNFYTYGVASTQDPQWTNSFENVYKGNDLQIDWHPVLGNHDYHGNTQAQIDYTKISRRWVMPSAYYTFTKETDDNSKIRFMFIDTNPFVKKYRKKLEEYPDLAKQDTTKQWQWIDSVLTTSNTAKEDWKIVIGHHPIYSSNPKHGDTKELHHTLKPRLENNKVHAYFCGHDHDLQHQKPQNSFVDYFLSGAGSETRPSAKHEHTLCAESVPGFAIVSIKENKLTLYFINSKNEIVYQYTRIKE